MVNRRSFLQKSFKTSVVAFSAVAWGSLATAANKYSKVAGLSKKKKKAATCPHLIDLSMKNKGDETNNKAVAFAKNLGYVENVTKAVKTGKAHPKAGALCGNCMFFIPSAAGNKTCGKCKIIAVPGAQVSYHAWCKSWVKKA